MTEQDHSELSQKFEQIGEVSWCKECGKEKSKHILTVNCPKMELDSIAECFRCLKSFEREYVLAKGDYSLKNNWDYWTEKEENKGKFICNSCLLDLYYNDKKRYLWEVKTKKKRQIMRVYVNNKTIK